MPYIEIKTNVSADEAKIKEVHSLLGREIELIPGKTEKWLMTNIRTSENMFFAGSDAPCLIAEVKIFGKASDEAYDELTASLCAPLGEVFGIKSDRVYVKYEEVSHWGWNGMNF